MAATLGERLKQLVREKGLEQQQVASDLGIKTSTFNGYVGNKREPPMEYLKKFADYFNVTIDYLLGYSDIPNYNLDHLDEELINFIRDPENKVYIELAMDIKRRTNLEQNQRKYLRVYK